MYSIHYLNTHYYCEVFILFIVEFLKNLGKIFVAFFQLMFCHILLAIFRIIRFMLCWRLFLRCWMMFSLILWFKLIVKLRGNSMLRILRCWSRFGLANQLHLHMRICTPFHKQIAMSKKPIKFLMESNKTIQPNKKQIKK